VRSRSIAFVTAALSAVLALPHAASATETDSGPGTRIIGGEVVSDAPWAAAVFNDGNFNCSGSLIAERYVLTAAHCVLSDNMSVRVGSVYYADGGTEANVVSTATNNDLALLELDTSLTTGHAPLGDANPPAGSTNEIYGWGQTCFDGCGASEQLKTASVRFEGLTQDAAGGEALHSSAINGNAWYGDSGGPQFYDGQIVGVASTADGVSTQQYGSVAYNREWIRSVAGV
jgi:secreted trypsin-like serine protease